MIGRGFGNGGSRKTTASTYRAVSVKTSSQPMVWQN